MRCPPVVVLISAALLIIAAGCEEELGSSRRASTARTATSTPAGPVEENTVILKNTQFLPARLVVKVGTNVVWINEDSKSHIPIDDDNEFRVGLLGPGGIGAFEFENPGIHTYHCSIHPSMKGTIVIQ